MTLLRDRTTGYYVGEFEYNWYSDKPVRLSMRTKKKGEASERHNAMLTVFRMKERARPIIDALRKRSKLISVEAIAQMVRAGDAIVLPEPPLTIGDSWRTVGEAIDGYLDWIEAHQRKADSTRVTAASQLARFGAFVYDGVPMRERDLGAVTSQMFEDYQRDLAEHAKPNTVKAYAGRVHALWRWLERTEIRSAREERRTARPVYNPVDPDKLANESTRRDRRLTEAEAERLLAATPEPLLCPIAIGLFAGMRLGEVLHLRPELDVDLERGLLSVRAQGEWRPKTKKSVRDVPMTPDLKPIIEHQLEHYASERWLIPSLSDPDRPFNERTFTTHFTAIVARAELPTGRTDPEGVVFHTLRHTFASWLAMRGVDLYTIAQLLGDSLATVEAVYARLSPDFKSLAVKKLGGAVKLPALGVAA